MTCLIGIDGGGSHTRGVLTDTKGNILSSVKGLPSSPNIKTRKEIYVALSDLCRRLLNNGHVKREDVLYVAAGFAGAGSKKNHDILEKIFSELGFREKNRVLTDIDITVEAALHNGEGILLHSGTGSFAVGKDALGKTTRLGGWGYILGDEGSGFAIGLAAIKMVIKNFEKGVSDTSLRSLVLETLTLDSVNDLPSIIYSNNFNVSKIAELAPSVLTEAENGTAPAVEIIKNAVKALNEMVDTLLATLDFSKSPVNIVFSGSTLTKSAYFRKMVIDLFGERGQETKSLYYPVLGAIMAAMKSKGIILDEEIRNNLGMANLEALY